MRDILTHIVEHKIREVAAARRQIPLEALRARALARPRDAYRSFSAALRAPGVRCIAEIKRASPSRGPLCPDLDPAALARAYAAGGASALSVLTDRTFFKGTADDLAAARAATCLPVLRKDFILDAYQVYESAAMGADAVLLIVRILSDDLLRELYTLARQLGLDVLVEIHALAEVPRVCALDAALVGINNRDLASFATDLSVAIAMARRLGPSMLPIALSGIATRADIERNLAAGIRCFLIGESLVRASDPTALLQTLCGAEAQGTV